jgi:hypothetical protein
MRHAESTSNVAERQGTLGAWLEVLRTADPPLSVHGRTQSMLLRNSLNEPDFVFTSPLRRAIETAQLIWPHKEIHIAPFLIELGRSLPLNKPKGKKATTKGNLRLFIQWLKNFIRQHPTGRSLTQVVVVTHSLLMKRDLGLKKKPGNNEIVDVWL